MLYFAQELLFDVSIAHYYLRDVFVVADVYDAQLYILRLSVLYATVVEIERRFVFALFSDIIYRGALRDRGFVVRVNPRLYVVVEKPAELSFLKLFFELFFESLAEAIGEHLVSVHVGIENGVVIHA